MKQQYVLDNEAKDGDFISDKAITGLVALMEEEFLPMSYASHQGTPSLVNDDITMWKYHGMYLPSCGDRYSWTSIIDEINDGFPEYANVTFEREGVTGGLTSVCMFKIKRAPKGYFVPVRGQIYRMTQFLFSPIKIKGANIITHTAHYVIDARGKILPVVEPGSKMSQYYPKYAYFAGLTLGFWGDRRHLWNVEAVDKDYFPDHDIPLRVSFGVYESAVKGLFYARDLPRTKTNRLSPILHWVKAHKRRLREQVEIDINKHLRGVNSFQMDGLEFNITRPMKRQSCPESAKDA